MDRADEGFTTFAAMWSATVARTPNAPFLVFADVRARIWTYAEFDRTVAASCRLLTSHGVGKADPSISRCATARHSSRSGSQPLASVPGSSPPTHRPPSVICVNRPSEPLRPSVSAPAPAPRCLAAL